MEQGFFQFVEGGEIALIEGGEAAGFGGEGVEFLYDDSLLCGLRLPCSRLSRIEPRARLPDRLPGEAFFILTSPFSSWGLGSFCTDSFFPFRTGSTMRHPIS